MKKYILLDNIRSLLNVGAIFRTVDGAGFDKVILTGFTPTPPRKEISKTAIGAEQYVDWEYYEDPTEILKELKKQGFKIITVEQTQKSIDFRKLEIR
ncbi:MAG: TrmH family RNA methyltransferase, partial [Candidatus Gracilibacteria bacterium]|nr:TrmH family RNA methyltransferase [Candidatus Gracilibacteria bacterium]